MSDLNLDRLEALAKNAQPFVRPGGVDPATVTIPAADLLALIQRTRKLANYGNAINATLPAEVVRLTATVEVRALHQPAGRHNFCGTCAYAPWPCATYRALDGGVER